METKLNGNRILSIIKTNGGDREVITRCLDGKTSIMSIFLPFNSMEGAENAMELEQ